ncbi:GvpL/GvpF family gas vesicle protein [Streptantibioticus rubrisoli]|uniref:GvpL/GvpF family gas vesicle protein n=1 Tax=Streptantibioticus rubrisoli TaxID=1387313 RepID=A0ABT1PEB7_9ACTN|nr:GvpL/GvpF family gas vesicle protein [Streptantibioticus rubrisoli]MCQ4043720.1 GvpL/GvpF family gas vesicle protein [Streptantibioticus rubrisoli]
MSDDCVSYVYAVGQRGPALESAAAAGTAASGHRGLRAVFGGQLGALVSSVPADQFSEEGVKSQLESLDQLEAIARAHHAVVAAAWEETTVLPMRLATVFLDDARVADMLRNRADELARLLGQLEGHVEWGVKVYADPHGAPTPAAPVPSGTTGAGPGRDYLRQRRARRRVHEHVVHAAEAVAARVAEAAGEVATAGVAHRPQQNGAVAAGSGENVANYAFLVRSQHTQRFQRAVRSQADGMVGVRIEITGPWAPYSFSTSTTAAHDGSTPADAHGH